jgi:hypothetical protein
MLGLSGLLLIAASRSPYLLLHGRFFAEEGTYYFAHMKHGGFWYVARPVGYFLAFSNVATWSAAHVPLEQAPLVTVWLSLGVLAALVWAALWLPSELLPNAAGKIAAATLLVVGPLAIPVTWLNTANAQTYLGLLAVVLLFVDVVRIRLGPLVVVAALLALAGLSGLYAAALAPLFVVRAVREGGRRRLALAGIMSVCLIVQLIIVQVSRSSGDLAQGRLTFRGFGVITRDVSSWHLGSFLFGTANAARLHAHGNTFDGLALLGLFALVVAGVLAAVLATVPRPRVALLLIAAFVIEEFLILFGTRRGAGGRYVVVPVGILLLMSVHALAAARARWAAVVAGGLCLLALGSGVSEFWDRDPSMQCVQCPEWDQQVQAWRGGADVLVIWPYARRWVVALPHAKPEDAAAGPPSCMSPAVAADPPPDASACTVAVGRHPRP